MHVLGDMIILSITMKVQEEMFKYDMWIAPIHLGVHWAMMVSIKLYSSFITHELQTPGC